MDETQSLTPTPVFFLICAENISPETTFNGILVTIFSVDGAEEVKIFTDGSSVPFLKIATSYSSVSGMSKDAYKSAVKGHS